VVVLLIFRKIYFSFTVGWLVALYKYVTLQSDYYGGNLGPPLQFVLIVVLLAECSG